MSAPTASEGAASPASAVAATADPPPGRDAVPWLAMRQGGVIKKARQGLHPGGLLFKAL